MHRCGLSSVSGGVEPSAVSALFFHFCEFKTLRVSQAAVQSSLKEAAGGMEGMFSLSFHLTCRGEKSNGGKVHRAALRRLPGRSRCESRSCASHKHLVYPHCYLLLDCLAACLACIDLQPCVPPLPSQHNVGFSFIRWIFV